MRLDDGVGWAFDAAFDTQGRQEVTDKRRLTRAQIAAQMDLGVANEWTGCQSRGETLRVALSGPLGFKLIGCHRFALWRAAVPTIRAWISTT